METGRDSYKLIWAHHVTHADDDFSRNAAVEDRLVPWVRGAGLDVMDCWQMLFQTLRRERVFEITSSNHFCDPQ